MSRTQSAALSCFVLLFFARASAQLPGDVYRLVESEKLAAGQGITGHMQPAGLARTMASSNFLVHYYRCEFSIDPAMRYISGKVTSYFSLSASSNTISFDLSDTLVVDSVLYHGLSLPFTRPGSDALRLHFNAALATGTSDSVSVYYQGTPRTGRDDISRSFAQNNHNGVPGIYTLSEPYGGKEWWPCKNGLTDKADSVDIIISSPAGYRGVSNGVLISENTANSITTAFYKHRYPIATYLLGIAVTNYVISTDSVRLGSVSMPVILNTYPENLGDFAYPNYIAKICLAKFTSLFGEYPFIKEHYAQTQWGTGGGMEHQTNTFIGSTWNQTVAHELGHQWFGDKVTCGSWQHIWLNEGFANYTQFIFVQNFDTTLIVPHLLYYRNLIISKPDGSVFVPDTTSVDRIFDGRLTYAKGGYVVHMLRGILGDSLFFKGIRSYLGDPLLSHKFAVTEDLRRNLENVSGRDLGSFFQKWIYGEGYPSYTATWKQNSNHWAAVQISQSTSHPSVSFYDMPVRLKFKNAVRDTTMIVENRVNGETFNLNIGFTADTMFIDPDYWILAKDRLVTHLPVTSTRENDIRIFPVPARTQITVQVLNPSIHALNLRLYNMAGQLVYHFSKSLSGNDELLTVPAYRFARGAYTLTVSDSRLIYTRRLLIE